MGITIHVHQDRNCQPLIDLITDMVTDIFAKNPSLQKQIRISYRSDDPSYADAKTDKNYEGTHILLSLSQCAGLDSQYATGSLLLASKFVPYDIENREIQVHSEYEVENDLMNRIADIVQSPWNMEAVKYIENTYRSANQMKSVRDSPRLMTNDDFPQTRILQVDQLWNPADGNELVLANFNQSSKF